MSDPLSEQVIARAGEAAIEALTLPAQEFLTKASGTPGDELGNLLGDRIRLRRWKQTCAGIEKAQKYARKANLPVQELPLNVLFPLLEGMANSDPGEDGLTDRWAALLANSAGGTAEAHPLLPSLLERMNGADARALETVAVLSTGPRRAAAAFAVAGGTDSADRYAVARGVLETAFRQVSQEQHELVEQTVRGDPKLFVSAVNRLQILGLVGSYSNVFQRREFVEHTFFGYQLFREVPLSAYNAAVDTCLTDLGSQLHRAVSPPGTGVPETD